MSSSFFSSGTVDVASFDRSKLTPGIYRVRISDFADHLEAFSGSRTQLTCVVVDGPSNIGATKSSIVMHKHEKAWQAARSRGEIATMLGAFAGMTRDAAGLKVTAEFFHANTRTLKYVADGKEVGSTSRESTELPLVKAGAEAILVVKPYFDRKTGARKVNAKTGEKSVVYEFYPLSSGFVPGATESTDDSDAPAAPSEPEDNGVDTLALAMAAGWKANGTSGWYYLKGNPSEPQLREAALRAKFAG